MWLNAGWKCSEEFVGQDIEFSIVEKNLKKKMKLENGIQWMNWIKYIKRNQVKLKRIGIRCSEDLEVQIELVVW